MRKFLFDVHWLLGITAGLIITIVGVTGGMLSLERQILQWMNPGIITVTPAGSSLSPEQLLEKVAQQATDKTIANLTLYPEANLAAEVRFAPLPGQRRGEQQYLNPYSGELLGQPVGREFFIDVMRLHRWLLAGDVGKQIVGASTVILIVLSLTGIYFRWPKGKKRWGWRYWLTWRKGKSGRPFWWQVHAVVGTWVLPLYILACVTGLYWSYEWYRDGLYQLTGVERPQRGGPMAPVPSAADASINTYWAIFQQEVTDYQKATIDLPVGEQFSVNFLSADAKHLRANSRWQLDTQTLNTNQALFNDKPIEERLITSMLPLHSGEYFGFVGLIAMMIASLLMPLFFITGWYLYLSRKKKQRQASEKKQTANLRTA
ncbi:PepSY-associated TM helix domain-containing protein [Methylophaga sp. OBS3]|uniref:PepSY-associated TM helix domain-containing protein n=1 Tax=Methylophaga sp. OBS3 TaxID=2991934 RepID=UPI00225A52DC|nr:PepSY-associated TM helix domain-containing protein [Methylophaga sp. OBS3]MCX4188979.1 PepSY domain-containing protein [Methylophaga sp. OBS3]